MRQITRKNFLRIATLHLALLGLLAIALSPVHTAATTARPSTAPVAISQTADLSPISPVGLPKTTADSGNIKRILQVAWGIIGAFALLNITLSGMKYITSAGNPQKTSEAKNGIVYSIIGLVIAISAEAIVAFVVHRT